MDRISEHEVAGGESRERAAAFVRRVERTRAPLDVRRRGVPLAELWAAAGRHE